MCIPRDLSFEFPPSPRRWCIVCRLKSGNWRNRFIRKQFVSNHSQSLVWLCVAHLYRVNWPARIYFNLATQCCNVISAAAASHPLPDKRLVSPIILLPAYTISLGASNLKTVGLPLDLEGNQVWNHPLRYNDSAGVSRGSRVAIDTAMEEAASGRKEKCSPTVGGW